MEKTQEAQAALRRAIDDVKAALELRMGYAAKANDTRRGMEERVSAIDAEVEAAKAEQAQLAGARRRGAGAHVG